MNKIENFATYCTTSQKASYTALDGISRYNVVKQFYNDNGISLPVSITVKQEKTGKYLTKDEKLSISMDYIKSLQNGEVSEDLANNFRAVTDPETKAVFSETAVFSESVNTFGYAVTAAKMLDALSIPQREQFQKIRKFEVKPQISVSEIPQFIEALKKIYEDSTKENK